jgi:hypothetical protein
MSVADISADRAGTQDPSRTVGCATGNAGTDIAGLLAVRNFDSPTEATTELAGADIVERRMPAKCGGSPCHAFGQPGRYPGPKPDGWRRHGNICHYQGA